TKTRPVRASTTAAVGRRPTAMVRTAGGTRRRLVASRLARVTSSTSPSPAASLAGRLATPMGGMDSPSYQSGHSGPALQTRQVQDTHAARFSAGRRRWLGQPRQPGAKPLHLVLPPWRG